MNEMRETVDEITLLLLRYLMKDGRLIEAWADDYLSTVDLSATRLLAICQINKTGEPLSLSQLASCLAFAKSNATQLIDNLEANELVRRVPSPNDRRSMQLEVTEKGKKRHAEALKALLPLAEKLDALYTSEERVQLLELLQRMSPTHK